MDFWTWSVIGFVLGVVSSSFFEWALHRYVMHRKVPGLTYSFERHAMVHHRVFKADETYQLIREEDKQTVPMAWWNGPVLIIISQTPFALCAWLVGNVGLLCGSVLMTCAYYGAYEYSALVHARAAEARGGKVGNFLPSQRSSFAPPPLHEPKLQCRAAAGRLAPRYALAPLEGPLWPGHGAVYPQRATARRAKS